MLESTQHACDKHSFLSLLCFTEPRYIFSRRRARGDSDSTHPRTSQLSAPRVVASGASQLPENRAVGGRGLERGSSLRTTEALIEMKSLLGVGSREEDLRAGNGSDERAEERRVE